MMRARFALAAAKAAASSTNQGPRTRRFVALRGLRDQRLETRVAVLDIVALAEPGTLLAGSVLKLLVVLQMALIQHTRAIAEVARDLDGLPGHVKFHDFAGLGIELDLIALEHRVGVVPGARLVEVAARLQVVLAARVPTRRRERLGFSARSASRLFR